DDASSCKGTNTCDPSGACKKKVAVACSAAAECASGECVDGVCCATACNGQCESCNEPGTAGQCVVVTGTPRKSRAPCIAGAPCGGTCDGVARATCAYPGASTVCG